MEGEELMIREIQRARRWWCNVGDNSVKNGKSMVDFERYCLLGWCVVVFWCIYVKCLL